MSRKYSPIGIEDFKAEVAKAYEKYWKNREFNSHVTKDLSKIDFDMENMTMADDKQGFNEYPCGTEELAPGFPVHFVNAGGDWEFPICFVLYWAGKRLRGYIPTDGNAFNRQEKCAYGSEADSDGDEDMDEIQKTVDADAIRKDVLNRIVPA